MGYNSELHGNVLKKTLQELNSENQSLVVVGTTFFHSQPGLDYLIKEGTIKETKVIISASTDIDACLKSATCKELSRLPLDHPSALIEDKELLSGLSLTFYFNRKHPLVRYSVSQKDERSHVNESQVQLNEGEMQLALNGDTKKQSSCSTEAGIGDAENNILLNIKPADYPSILVTGNTPIAQIAKINNIGDEIFSVFVVPHQESKECLSLLPEDTKKLLMNSVSLSDAALHLALYHRRESFQSGVDGLKGKRIEENGKSFLHYYRNVCKPEAELAAMLQNPEAKVSSFLVSNNAQLDWYKKHQRVFTASVNTAVLEEKGKQQKSIAFFRDSLAWAYCYSHIRAEVYVISAADLSRESCMEVVNGIIIANIWRKTKCCIVITDSLPHSLDEVIQRDVRKLAFADESSAPIIRVGFLDKHSPNSARSTPFFTINPWSQAQRHVSKYHTVSVDTSRHTVSGLGDEHLMHLIKDDLDIKEEISTKNSNMIISHITHSHRPSNSGKREKEMESRRLETYLKLIGHKVTYTSYGMDDVLSCLIGPLLVLQLKDIASKDVPDVLKIIPDLLNQKASGNSRFVLSATELSASKAEIDVFISKSRPVQVQHVGLVKSATFSVKNARTMSVDITLKANINSKSVTVNISKHLDVKGSCGKTVADHIYSICSKEDAWIHAKDLTVGEVLHVFLGEEKAVLAIQSLPLFLSFPLSKCKINHYLTTVLVDSSRTLQEAHIHVNQFKLSPVLINKCKLDIRMDSLTMHLFPLLDADKHMIQIEGKCFVTTLSIPMTFTCSSSLDSQKNVTFFIADTLPATKAFELFGINTNVPPESLSHPISGGSLNNKVSYEAGFTLSQLLRNTEEGRFTSLILGAEFSCDVAGILPPALGHIQQVKIKTVVHFPSTTTPKLGLKATFTSSLEIPSSSSADMGIVMLECCLSVCPSITDNSCSYMLTVRQYSNRCEPQEFRGVSVYALISALSGTQGRSITEEVGKIPKLGDQIFNNISLRKMMLQLENRQIKTLELNATISELDIIQDKLSVNDCTLILSYSMEGLKLECDGNVTFLRRYKYAVNFSLPTAEKKGEMSFISYNNDLIFKDVMQEFGWLSKDVKSNPVLTEVLDIVVKRVALEFHFTSKEGKLQITASDISVFKEKLDIGLVTLHGIELDVSTKLVSGHYLTAFSLGAYLSDALYAQLKYNPDNRILAGKVRVAFSKSVSGVDVLQTFKPSTTSYDNMKCILKEDFMDVFKSDLKIVTQPGLTACLSVSISLPSKQSKQYTLERLNLEVEDVLKICCNNNYILNSFQFEYLNRSQSEDVVSTSHLSLAVHKLESKENMTLDFDFTSKRDNTSSFTAKVEAGPEGGFLKLRSAIDLARAAIPGLPEFDTGLPQIFDIELLSGSVTFVLRPSFQPSAFDINILINEWRVFDDPKTTVHKLILKTTWELGNYPQLTFTDCSLTFLEHKLNLSGKLTSDEIYIKCCSAEKLPGTNPIQFKSILEDYTPKSQPQPTLPTDIGLPPMKVELKEVVIQLKKANKIFRVNAGVIARSPWKIKFGAHTVPVYELGGALEWEKLENDTIYKAFLYGTVELFGMQVDMEMLLGKNIDSIVSATISHPQCLHYGQIADHLLCSETITPYDQYNPKSSGLSELVPSTMQDISLTSAVTALNVTKKQFFLSSKVQGWGTGSLLIGCLVNKYEMDYVVSLSLVEGLKFGRLSPSLAFVDELLLLRSLDVLIASTDLKNMSDLTSKFCHSFSRSKVSKQLQKPFYESKILSSNKLTEYGIRAGTTIFAEIDISQSRGGINNLVRLGDKSSLEGNFLIMMYIGKSKTKKDLEIYAWIRKIQLFEVLTFADIHLIYRVQKVSECELTGTVVLDLKMSGNEPLLKFDGKLLVNPKFAEFSTHSCSDIVSRPCGIDIRVNSLKLALKMYLNGESPDLFVSGSLTIGCIALTCKFLLKGISFKVFLIRLEHGLMLSALFHCSDVCWPVKLDIGIKEGQFYYASSNITFEEDGKCNSYQDGYHLKAIITLFKADFRITANIPSDRSDMVLSGRSIKQIDFLFVKITGARPHTHEGPGLMYRGSERSLTLTIGLEILKYPCFEGELKYMLQDKSLEGTIRYPGRFLWIDEPSMKVRWSENDGFEIIDFSLFGDVPGFSFLGAIAKFAKVIYNLVTGILSWKVKLHLKTGKNPDPQKHLVKFVLYGEFIITVIGFSIPVLPLPEIPILLPRIDDFSFAKLPQYILKCLWDSAGEICKSLLKYINPWNLLKKSAQMIWNGVKGAVNTVVNVAKKVGQAVATAGRAVANTAKKIWRGICSIFGRSAFIIDIDNGMVLGYIRRGRGGKELCDEHYIVEQFGPILAANAIGAMAHDVYKHYKSCVDAKNDEKSSSDDEVDGEERELDRKTKEILTELKYKAEELAEKLTIEADKVLTVKDVSIEVDNKGENISLEWSVYNPEEETYYSEDKGDIDYYVKITAIVIDNENVKLVSIHDNIYTIKEECDTSKTEKKDVIKIADETQSLDNVLQSVKLASNRATADTTEASHNERDLSLDEGVQTSSEVSPPSLAVDSAQSHKVEQQLDDLTSVDEERDTRNSAHHKNDLETSYKEIEDTESDVQYQPPILNKCITFKAPCDPKTLINTMCINVSIQPRVTLEVKLLPPDKIAADEHIIDQNRLSEGDTSWMDDVKGEIERNGRINKVTLEGKKVCEHYFIKQSLDSKVDFTAKCHYQKDSLTVYGDVMSFSEAERYLVQIVDRVDLTVIIKQCLLVPPKLHYNMEVFPSDFPETSSGPYHISVIALHSDLSTCSAFTDSELIITRYCPPTGLTTTIPNLDSSNSDIVVLEWKCPKSNENKNVTENLLEASGALDSQSEENAAKNMPTEDAPIDEQDTTDKSTESDVLANLDLQSDDHDTSPAELEASKLDDEILSQKPDEIFVVTITGIHIKRSKESTKRETITIENINISEEALKISEPVHIKQDSQEIMKYEFSLVNFLKKNEHATALLDAGLLFQCQVVTNGLTKLQSMPKLFSDFVLLAPPRDLHVTTPTRRPGLHIGWEYSAHAIEYRVELVIEKSEDIVFSKVLNCEKGSHGEAVLCKSDFKDIPHTERGKGYQLRMYSLGFGQELIRCLHPSIAAGTFHVIPAELQYLKESGVVRVKFTPFANAKTDYVVQLCRFMGDDEEPLHLTAKYVYDHELYGATDCQTDFLLKKWWHLLQSGDLVIAWVRSISTNDQGITYIGSTQNEVCVLNSPNLKTCQNYNSNWTISGMKLMWSKVKKAQRYQCGYFLPETNEYIIVMETQENEAIIYLNRFSLCQIQNSCQFQTYVAAQGKPGTLSVGELSINTNILQYIESDSQEKIIFTAISLQQMWRNHLGDYFFSNYLVIARKDQHILFPSGAPFPSLNIPAKFRKKFWKSERPLFENSKNHIAHSYIIKLCR